LKGKKRGYGERISTNYHLQKNKKKTHKKTQKIERRKQERERRERTYINIINNHFD
jgi:hypothetical protein